VIIWPDHETNMRPIPRGESYLNVPRVLASDPEPQVAGFAAQRRAVICSSVRRPVLNLRAFFMQSSMTLTSFSLFHNTYLGINIAPL
jgi:hypothetical protein